MGMVLRKRIVLSGVLACVAFAGAQVNLKVDLEKASVAPISPDLFGANLLFWIDDDESLAVPEIRKAIEDAGIRLLRFPGGTVADNYLWKENRLARQDRFPYEDGEPTTDWLEFLASCRSMDIEPIFVVNTESFARAGMVEIGAAYAAEWVRAVKDAGYHVTYWEIGNETYWHEVMGAEDYAQVVRVYAEAMRAADLDIKLGINGHWSIEMVGDKDRIDPAVLDEILAQDRAYSGSQEKKDYRAFVVQHSEKDILVGEPKWWPTVIQECGDVIDFLIVHCYHHHTEQLRDLDLNLIAIRQLYKQTWPGRAVELAMTEYNTVATYRKNAQAKPYLCGLSGGLISMLRAEVELACFWPLRIGGYWSKVGLINRETHAVQTAVPVLRLFTDTIGKTTVPVAGGRGMLMGVAAHDDADFSVYLSDFDLKQSEDVCLGLPPGWIVETVRKFEEEGAGLKSGGIQFEQNSGSVRFVMPTGSLVVVQGKFK